MATWVTHLIIADGVLAHFPGLHRRGFCVGNIAPDCNVENADWTEFTPSREVTHWMQGARKKASDCDAFCEEYILKRKGRISSTEEYAFLLGYYAHLITDAAFQAMIRDAERVAAVWKRIKADGTFSFDGMEETWDTAKKLISKKELLRDIEVMEAAYLCDNPNSGYLTEIMPLKDFTDYIDYLPHGAIVRKIGVMGYLPEKNDPGAKFIAISREEYAEFVRNTIRQVIDTLEEKLLVSKNSLIMQYSNLCHQYNTDVEIAISQDIDRKLQVDGNRILINDNQIPENELEGCIAYAVRQVLLPQMEIETPRLLLRPFRMSDSMDCFGFLCDREDCLNDGGFEPFTQMDEEYYALMEQYSQQPLRKMIVRKDTGKVIGTVNIIEVNDRAVETYEIGYCINKDQQRNGYGYEAVSTLCDCLLNTLHIDLLIAGAIEKNTVSLRMLQKMGFRYEGRKTKGFWHPVDGAIDLLYYVKERTS